MNVLLLNTTDRGGAGKACLRLHNGLIQKSINSKLLVKDKTSNNYDNVYSISPTALNRNLLSKLNTKAINILKEFNIKINENNYKNHFLKDRDSRLEYFSFPDSKYWIHKSNLYSEADIINLHWVSNFIDYPTFFKNNNKPVVWTLHDMNPFSGGEHYEEIYLGIDDNGYPLRRKITSKERDYSKKILEIKQKALTDISNLHIVSLCHWMHNIVKKDSIFSEFTSHIIPNGIDTNIFNIRNKILSRNIFNIPNNKIVLLFISDSINNERKGIKYLYKSLEQIENPEVIVVSVGKKKSHQMKSKNIIELGNIYDDKLLSIIYSLADVLILPSLIDNLPNTAIESLLCGTPVIGFPVGGINEIIIDEKNGLLTDEISVNALKKSITKFINHYKCFNRYSIRNEAKIKYDIINQSETYINLFKTLLH